MWPFKKQGLHGMGKNSKGELTLKLTPDEKLEILKYRDEWGSEIVLKNEHIQELDRCINAYGLKSYALKQMKLFIQSNSDVEKKDIITKAIAAITKAYEFSPLPIFIYDSARFMEMDGATEPANNLFAAFLRMQENFHPSEVQKIFIRSEKIQSAIEYCQGKAQN